jgi:hypothetical protein
MWQYKNQPKTSLQAATHQTTFVSSPLNFTAIMDSGKFYGEDWPSCRRSFPSDWAVPSHSHCLHVLSLVRESVKCSHVRRFLLICLHKYILKIKCFKRKARKNVALVEITPFHTTPPIHLPSLGLSPCSEPEVACLPFVACMTSQKVHMGITVPRGSFYSHGGLSST